MRLASHAEPVSFVAPSVQLPKSRVLAGRVISALVVVLLAFDAITKLIEEPHTMAAAAQMGLTTPMITAIGLTLSFCLVVYLIPRMEIVGAVLITGYLGGATATNLVLGQPVLVCLFPVVIGALLWLGLYLRDGRVTGVWAPRE
jgi:hypothetical protein